MKPDPEVIEYIEQFSPEFRKILYKLRELIWEVVPETKESVKWRMPNFSFRKNNICYIAGFKEHVTLAFHDGTMLKDPDKLLGGTGKLMKHIKFRSLEEINEERLKAWILEGFYT